jgi:hypothetical protein
VVAEAVAAAGAVAPDDLPSPPPELAYDNAEDLAPLLEAGALRLQSIKPVAFSQRYPSSQALWDGWLAAAIRTGPVLAAQSRQVQETARLGFEDRVAPYLGVDGAVDLPVAFFVITAAK